VDQVTRYCRPILAGLAIGILLLIFVPVSADVHIINPGDSIQTAINNADDDDIILLNPGAPYTQHGIEIAKNITIGANTAAGGSPANTIIDAQLLGRVFNVTGNVSLTVDHLTLQNGRAPNGANGVTLLHQLPGVGGHGGDGGAISAFGTVTILSSVLSGCSAGNGGTGGPGDSDFNPGAMGGTGGSGGAVNSTYGVTITDSSISSCDAGNGGTGGVSGGMMSPGGDGGKGGSGGAVSSDYPVTLLSSTISDCAAGTGGTGGDGSGETWGYGGDGGSGGALNTKTSHGPVTVTSSDITGCSAGDGGTSYDNRGGDGGHGGAIASLGPVTITSSEISACSAGDGGAASPDGYGGGGGAIYGYLEGDVTVTDSTITGNRAGSGRANTVGGPGRFDSGGPGGYGGAIYLYSSSNGIVDVTASTLTNNAAGNSGNGGAISSQLYVNMNSSTLTGNSVSVGGTGSATSSWYGEMKYNRIYGNLGGAAVKNENPVTSQDNQIKAVNNWWGFNGGPLGNTTGNVTSAPWLVLGATATPQTITSVQSSLIGTNLTYNNAGTDTSVSGYVPDEIPVAFTAVNGGLSLESGRTKKGNNATTFTPSGPGPASVSATVDGQTVTILFDIASPPPPTVSTISPATGPVAGGTSVIITGTGFIGTTAVQFGTTDAPGFTVDSDTQITVPSPAHAAGLIDITVTTPGGTSATSSADQFTYIYPVPAISAISPATGPVAGGTSVTITGTGFIGTTAMQFGTADAPGFTVDSDTQITVPSPAHAAGLIDITITTPGGTSATSSADQFTYIYPVPTVSGISPATGPVAGGSSVTITGTGFTGTTAVQFGTTDAPGFTVDSDTQITVPSPESAGGVVDITVTNPGGTSTTSSADQFTYIYPVPTVSGISPATGPVAGGTSVTITGTGFTGTTAVQFGTADAPGFTVDSDTQITVPSPESAGGVVDVTVTNPGGTSATSSADQFTYYYPVPTVSGISPATGPVIGGTTVTITGTGFVGTTAVHFGATDAPGFTVDSDTQITLPSPAGSAGTVDITVTNPGGTSTTSSADQFTYYYPVPTVTAISPTTGPVAGGTSVTVTGTGFVGTTAVHFGATDAPGFTVDSDTQITVPSPAGSAGTVHVTIITPGGTSLTSSSDEFIYSPIPAVTGISPADGPEAGGTSVIITGTGFTGATDVMFGTTAATVFTVNSDTRITATSPLHATGTVDVTVTTAGGISPASSSDQYTYVPIPSVTGISPSSGLTAGGTSVTITGTGLTTATAVMFDATAATGFTVVSDTEITVPSPSHAAGTVDVTVITAGGTSLTSSADQFEYIAPVPSVTGIAPASGPVAGGITVIITGTGLTAATAIMFDTTAATDFTVNSDTQITATQPAHAAGVVDVTVTTAGGTSPTSSADQFTYAYIPAVTGISPSSGPDTGGIMVTITGAEFTGATAVMFGTTAAKGFTVISGTKITAISPAGTGTVHVTVTTSGGTTGHSSSDRFTYFASTPSPTPTAPVTTLDTSGNSDDGPTVTIVPYITNPHMNTTENVTVNIGGDSAFNRAIVRGTGITSLIVTGTVTRRADDSPPPQGIVFEYAELVPARFNTIQAAEISFSIPQEWLDNQNIAPERVVLCRQNAGTWANLPTWVVDRKDGNVFFAAASPGFSLFAIAGAPESPTAAPTPTPVEIQPDETTFTKVPAKTPTVTSTTAAPVIAKEPPSGFPLMSILLVIAGLIVVAACGWYVRRWWIRRQNPALFMEYD
jgi:hypothetical protein